MGLGNLNGFEARSTTGYGMSVGKTLSTDQINLILDYQLTNLKIVAKKGYHQFWNSG